MNEPLDNIIMLSVKAGDIDKMGLLFNRYHRLLYNFLFHMTYNREASEDMVQNVFYRMLKYRHTFTGNGEFRIWMYHLARNVLKDHMKNRKKTSTKDNIDALADKTGGGDPADEPFGKKQDKLQLYQAMEKLKDEDREILTLSKFQELKYQEIARIMDMNEGTVKVRVHRAFHQLKNIYQQQGLI